MRAEKKRTSEIISVGGAYTSRDWLTYWQEGSGEGPRHHLHLWALVEPAEQCQLRVYPVQKNEGISGVLRCRSPRGEVVNECEISASVGQLVKLPISSFLEECETDGGCRHAHLELVTDVQVHGEVELSTRTRTTFLPPLHRLSEREPQAFPTTFGEQYRHLCVIVNPTEQQCAVRCRLYVGTRAPEETCLVPPNGVFLLSPEVLFSSLLSPLMEGKGGSEGASHEAQGYLRLLTRSGRALGFHVVEERTFASGERVFGALS
ncbi:hypothetical protein MRY87_09635 [bacterium]|nr:hypothetical protein [bacterium]